VHAQRRNVTKPNPRETKEDRGSSREQGVCLAHPGISSVAGI
jgi:hypothetical protein